MIVRVTVDDSSSYAANGRLVDGRSGADGPYRLVDRLGAQDAMGYLVQAHSTQAYRNEQFVGSAITFPRLAAMLRSYAADGRLEPGTAQSLLAPAASIASRAL